MMTERFLTTRRGPVPLTGCDSFHLALDASMRRAGQGRNLGQIVVELDGALDPKRLRIALERLAAEHPIIRARLRRTMTRLPVWALSADDRLSSAAVPVVHWREAGVLAAAVDARACEDGHAVCEHRLSEPLDPATGRTLYVDVVWRADGGTTLVITFAHVLLDALGAELLLAELDRLGSEDARLRAAVPSLASGDRTRASLPARIARAAPAGRYLDGLGKTGFRSLARATPRAARPRWRVATLDPHDSACAFARAERACGPLVTMPFFLACAVRAHDRVFRLRGRDPGAYVVSIPVQTRVKGERGPIFQNHVSILFFHVARAQAERIDDAVEAVRSQLTSMMRARLDVAFATGMELARRLPSRLVVAAVRRQFHGEICSFFHSYTGAFADELDTFLGASIRNAYHTPAVAAPPGTGLFIGARKGRLNVTLTWREGVLDDREATALLDAARDDLRGP